MNIQIGPVVFDHADHDAEHDVLYLHVGAPEHGAARLAPSLRFEVALASGQQRSY